MLEFAIAIATAVVVAGLGLLGAALIGQAILDGIEDVCKDKDDEEDSRASGTNRDQDHDPFLT